MARQAARAVVVTGATGLLGRRLVRNLVREGVPVHAVSRSPARAASRLEPGVECFGWDGLAPPGEVLAGARAVVHLAGEPVFSGLPTRAHLERVRASRVEPTRALARALGALAPDERPATLVAASAVGFYGSRCDEWVDESAAPGSGFLARVCVAWEEAAREAEAHGVRVVSLRFGIVLARDGGALPAMARPFRLGLGGRLGDGRQWVPWVHRDDAIALLRRTLDDDSFRGPVNVVSPEPVRNETLTGALARTLHRPAWLPAPAVALRAVLGELADELLGSRRVRPSVAGTHGFEFACREIEDALARELG